MEASDFGANIRVLHSSSSLGEVRVLHRPHAWEPHPYRQVDVTLNTTFSRSNSNLNFVHYSTSLLSRKFSRHNNTFLNPQSLIRPRLAGWLGCYTVTRNHNSPPTTTPTTVLRQRLRGAPLLLPPPPCAQYINKPDDDDDDRPRQPQRKQESRAPSVQMLLADCQVTLSLGFFSRRYRATLSFVFVVSEGKQPCTTRLHYTL